MYSYASAPSAVLDNYGQSEFLTAIEGKPADAVMRIMDELMDSMQVLQPRIYDSVIRKVSSL